MFRYKIIVVIILLGFVLDQGLLSAAWWDTKSLPVPPKTTEVKQLNRKSKSTQTDIIFYDSTLSKEAICDFYREKFGKSGWEEKDPFTAMGQIPDLPQESGLKNVSQSTLIFRKENQTVVLRFISKGTKTSFVLGRNWMDPSVLKLVPDIYHDTPALSAKPGKAIAPLYPQAKMVGFSEDSDTQKAVYFSKDNIESIASFYKFNMPGFGWLLDKEGPVESIDFSKRLPQAVSKDCPDCHAKINDALKQKGVVLQSLNFLNSLGGACSIYLFRPSDSGVGKNPAGYTVIMVNYAKKK